MTAWIAIALVGAGSLTFRLAPILALAQRPLSPLAERALQHGATAMLAALAGHALVSRAGDAHRGLAAALTVVVIGAASRRTRSFGLLVGAGLAATWLTRGALALL
jgi:branched-subunit amino acid transport protein